MNLMKIYESTKQLEEKIREDNNYVFTGISMINVTVASLNILLLGSPILGFLNTVLYLLINGAFLGKLLQRVLGPEKWLSTLFGVFLVIFLTGASGSFFIVLYVLTKIIVVAILVFLSITISITSHKVRIEEKSENAKNENMNKAPNFSRMSRYLPISFLLLISLGFVILLSSRTYESSSLWVAISPAYIYLYFLIVLILGPLIFSNYGTKSIFLFIMLYSFLLYSYIAIVCGTYYGSDAWTNLGELKPILDQKPIGPFTFPQNLYFKPSRGIAFAVEVIFSYLSQVDIYWLNSFLVPLLWASFAPATLFQIGRYFSNDRRYALLLSIVPSLFYNIIVRGSYTVGAGFGFIFLLLPILFWTSYLIKGGRPLFLTAVFVTLASCFNYTLMFILSVEVAVSAILIKVLIPPAGRNKTRSLVVVILLMPIALVVPSIDTLIATSFKPEILQNPSSIVPNFLKWIADVSTLSGVFGDGVQFYIPSLAVASTILTWVLIVVGLTNSKKIDHRAIILMVSMLVITQLGYFVTWYLMDGAHPLGRYLNAPMYLFAVPLVALGLVTLPKLIKVNFFVVTSGKFRNRAFRKRFNTRAATILICVFLAVASTSAYAVDPMSTWVSSNEVAAMTYIYENTHVRYCVIAEPFELVALQGISAGNVTSGNFPVTNVQGMPVYQVAQYYVDRMVNDPSNWTMERAMNETNTDMAYYVVPPFEQFDYIQMAMQFLGSYMQFGNVFVFQHSRTNS